MFFVRMLLVRMLLLRMLLVRMLLVRKVVVVVGRLVVGVGEREILQEILETTCIAVCSGLTCTLRFIPLKFLGSPQRITPFTRDTC
jgi:hypothetical protein